MDMNRRYMDAMAIVHKFGKPDFFITLTCNLSWPEITIHLAPGELPQNRHDLLSRVFKAKLEMLKRDIVHHRIFGKPDAYVYSIEFKKRGLPHAHILLFVTRDAYDRFISGELNDPVLNPRLHERVLKHMIHGPCGSMNMSPGQSLEWVMIQAASVEPVIPWPKMQTTSLSVISGIVGNKTPVDVIAVVLRMKGPHEARTEAKNTPFQEILVIDKTCRVQVKIDGDTGNVVATMYDENAEQLLDTKAEQTHEMQQEDISKMLMEINEKFQTKGFTVIVKHIPRFMEIRNPGTLFSNG